MSYRKLSSIGSKTKEKFEIIVPQIKTLEDKKAFLSSYSICCVDVYASWCGPCQIVSPIFDTLYKNYNLNGVVGLAKEDAELGLSPNVQVIPTFQYYVDGQLDKIITGADMEEVENYLITLIKSIRNRSDAIQQQPTTT